LAYKLWKSGGAEFITEPIPKYGEIRCYIRDQPVIITITIRVALAWQACGRFVKEFVYRMLIFWKVIDFDNFVMAKLPEHARHAFA
jgi:hypothetical protein